LTHWWRTFGRGGGGEYWA